MKRRIVVMLVVVAVLSLSLASHASAAGTRSPEHAAAGWLARTIAWIGKTVQPVLTLGSSVTPPGTAGAADVDRGGCIDPHGMSCN
jgi:hypothetical protein